MADRKTAKKTAFVTGISSGLGAAFAQWLLERGWQVYGISRRPPAPQISGHPNLLFQSLDLGRKEMIQGALQRLLDEPLKKKEHLALAILNAGLLGKIQKISETPQAALDAIMQVNVWANKAILDFFIKEDMLPAQVLAISSGASVNGHYGWGAYSLSKAALNMLIQLYAHEMPGSHLLSLAPGLIETKMQEYIYNEVDASQFPSVERLQKAYGTQDMPAPPQAADKILCRLPDFRTFASGSFVDIRKI